MSTSINDALQDYFPDHHVRHYNKRHILIYSGDPVPYVYHLVRGKVKQYVISYRGDEMILNVYKPPAFFPMAHAMNHTPAHYFFEAETDIEVRQLPADEMLAFLKSHPDILYDLLRRVYTGTEGLLGRTEQLMGGTAKTRLVYELILEAGRFGRQNAAREYVIELSEKDLGSRAGLSRETVNREIHKLKEASLIRIERHVIVIPDLEILKKHLDPQTDHHHVE